MEKTVVKALAVLELIARSDQPRGVTELAAEVNLSKSNVHRLLNTLIKLDYVRQDAIDRKYCCTLKLWELANDIVSRLEARKVAAPFMRELGQLTGETVHLSVLEGTEVVYIDKIESIVHPVRAYTKIGGRAPAHCVATGKALLAHVSSEVLRQLFGSLIRYTPLTITDPVRLETELKGIRDRGFAINRGEWRQHVCGVAAPVRDLSGQVVVAIGISGPADRMSDEYTFRVGPMLRRVAEELSQALGYMDGRMHQVDASNYGQALIR